MDRRLAGSSQVGGEELRVTAQIRNNLSLDFLAETLIANLLDLSNQPEKAPDFDAYLLQSRGGFWRGYSTDIASEKRAKPEKTMDEIEREIDEIFSNRDGLYDYLPEGLFHQLKSSTPGESPQGIKETIKQNQGEEDAARKFFLPFEQEFFVRRLQLETTVRRFFKAYADESIAPQLKAFWGISDLKFKDSSRVISFLCLLPYAASYVGKLAELDQAFSMILGVPVACRRVVPRVRYISSDFLPALDAVSLDVDFVLNGPVNDGAPALAIDVGPLEAVDIIDFLPGQSAYYLLQRLCDHFLPIEYEVTCTYTSRPEVAEFILNDEIPHAGRLDYTSLL